MKVSLIGLQFILKKKKKNLIKINILKKFLKSPNHLKLNVLTEDVDD